ncbi:major capsid protein [Elysia marginata]|uniref:Major capsid protein n=1 Tax=Elysia marginata TaxID=1093978 RepID=A0AAV4H3T7_9GAST|nr:major capsid protein [Elysia marginata]
MAQSGVTRLVSQDERFDKFFTASSYLRQRLSEIYEKRKQAGCPIPQPTFVDLERTHILYLRTAYRPYVSVACEYVRVKPSGDAATLSTSGGTVEFTFPVYGHFTSDMVFHVRFKGVGTTKPTLGEAANASPRFRFCAYPGIRLFQKVSFRSDETLIDDYLSDEVSFVNKFMVSADQRQAWDRGMGQADCRTAEYFNNSGFTGVLTYREGLQTPKYFHEPQDLWVPLQFWLCGDAANALLNDLVPNTQRTVVADLAPLGQIIEAVDPHSGQPVALPFDRLGLQIDLYVNNIFVNPEIHDLFASRVGFSLIRVHRRQHKILNKPMDSIHLDQLKYPAEFLYVGFRDRANLNDFDHWHLFGRARKHTAASRPVAPTTNWNSALNMYQLVCRNAKEVETLDPIITSFKLTAHGVDLFPSLPSSFFNAYLPQRYFAGTAVVSPRDTSACLATFCLYPGQSNPSGYYNLSAGRELYLSYHSNKVDAAAPAELVVSISALNFLVRKGDKCFLRYAL